MLRLTAARIVLPDGILADGEILVSDDGVITGVGPTAEEPAHDTICPGFVDLQVNGIDGVDVAGARGDDWHRLDQLLVGQGVTAWCPTLITDELDAYAPRLARIQAHADSGGPGPEIVGVHLEGPFLGARPGAHPRHLIREVDPAWLDALPPIVRLITAAPEADPAGSVWAWARSRGTIASVGHSGATAVETVAAARAGARMVTHLFNAMSGLDHRAPGVAAAALLEEGLVAGLIADGAHVHPDLVRLAFLAKGPAGIALVTDSVAWRGGRAGRVRLEFDGVVPRLADGTLAGSALRLDQAVANVIAWGATDLVGAVRAAATTPADLLGRSDIGRIAPGARADLTELGPDLRCRRTWVGGVEIA